MWVDACNGLMEAGKTACITRMGLGEGSNTESRLGWHYVSPASYEVASVYSTSRGVIEHPEELRVKQQYAWRRGAISIMFKFMWLVCWTG